MRPINAKKIIASSIIFFFSNFVSPSVVADQPVPANTLKTAQEKPHSGALPVIHLDVPRCVPLHRTRAKPQGIQAGSHAIIWTVPYSISYLDRLKELPLGSSGDTLFVVHGGYGNDVAAYVNMTPCDLKSGLLTMQHASTSLEKNLRPLLVTPEKYHVREELVNACLFPKIIVDTASGSSLLVMEPYDFRLSPQPQYSVASLEQMLTVSYSTMKGYATLQSAKKTPSEIHTSFWGGEYKNNARLTTTIQLFASKLAGVNRLVFHIDQKGEHASILKDARSFVESQNGMKVAAVLANLYQKTHDSNWQANSNMLHPF